MTEENKQVVTTEVTPQVTPQVAKEELLDVDIYGTTIPLPVSKAREIIKLRDSRHAVFKDLDSKVKEYETKLADTSRQAEAQKKALEGRLAEAETLFSAKANERLSKIHDRIINKEIEATLLEDESFLKESLEDAKKLLKADHSFALDESGDNIVDATGKVAKEVVSEWLKAKPIFRKAVASTVATGGRIVPGKQTTSTSQQPKVNWSEALAARSSTSKK